MVYCLIKRTTIWPSCCVHNFFNITQSLEENLGKIHLLAISHCKIKLEGISSCYVQLIRITLWTSWHYVLETGCRLNNITNLLWVYRSIPISMVRSIVQRSLLVGYQSYLYLTYVKMHTSLSVGYTTASIALLSNGLWAPCWIS